MYIFEGVAINWRNVWYALPLGGAGDKDPNVQRWRMYFSDEHYLDITVRGDPDDQLGEVAIVPAAPGFFVVEPVYSDFADGEPKESQQSPVIAWRIFNGKTEAVTVENNFGTHGILQPDGTVVEPDETTFETLAAWMTEIRRRESQKRQIRDADPETESIQ